jgi:hypothetical protein
MNNVSDVFERMSQLMTANTRMELVSSSIAE